MQFVFGKRRPFWSKQPRKEIEHKPSQLPAEFSSYRRRSFFCFSQGGVHLLCEGVHVRLHIDRIVVARRFANIKLLSEQLRPSQVQNMPEPKCPFCATNQSHVAIKWLRMIFSRRGIQSIQRISGSRVFQFRIEFGRFEYSFYRLSDSCQLLCCPPRYVVSRLR